jgi:hypothetical protein
VKVDEIRAELDELAACLKWASRISPDSPSNRRLRYLINRPAVLDYLEHLDNAERWRRASEQSAVELQAGLDDDPERRDDRRRDS